MTLHYDDIMPWGRSYVEYLRMFDLQESELRLRILGCGDGPASFNAKSHHHGVQVISVDPLYLYGKNSIEKRIQAAYPIVLKQTQDHREKFKWDRFLSIEDLGRVRMEAMRDFLEDYEEGKRQGRYIPGSLPLLPFVNHAFDLAICSHLLFMYSDNLTYDFHAKSILELLRVAKEVRLFPLLDMNGNESSYAARIIRELPGYEIERRKVDYEFQRGANELLMIRHPRN